jgi:hypothetical protein
MFGTALLIVTLRVLSDDRPITQRESRRTTDRGRTSGGKHLGSALPDLAGFSFAGFWGAAKVERVVDGAQDRHEVVEKIERAAEVAARMDPRS